MKKRPEVILITGASSGIGLAIACHLAEQGYKVYGIGKRADINNKSFRYVQVDITDEDQVRACINYILLKEGQIDVLINNAGTHVFGAIECIDQNMVSELFAVNLFGSLNLIRAVLPGMQKNKSGKIICISSIGGVAGLPFQGIYCASKFALEGMSESLYYEVRKSGIHVVLVQPGDVRTPITARRVIDPITLENTSYKPDAGNVLKQISSCEENGIDPHRVAVKVAQIIRMENPELRYTVAKADQRLVPKIRRLIPASFFTKIIQNYYGL